MEILLIKTSQGALLPADEEQAERLRRFKAGGTIRADVKQMRNGAFHRKFFAMLKVGFDAWTPPDQEYRGLPVQKNFNRFRKDCVIAAGFYEPVSNLRGEVRAEAKSIAFGNMTEAEFGEVYDAVANVLLQKVLTHYTREDLDDVVEQILRFL